MEHYLAGAEEEQGGIWGLRHKSQPMTAIRAQNVDDDNGMDVAKGAWGAPDSPKQEVSGTSKVVFLAAQKFWGISKVAAFAITALRSIGKVGIL